MILVLDNRDSFTFNLVQAFLGLGANVEVRRSDAIRADEVLALSPERLVIGPGPGGPRGAGCSLEVLRTLTGRLPILGVCLGHQAIGAAFGAEIKRANELVHGRAVRIEHDGHGVFRGLPAPLRATRYNSLSVAEETLPACLEVTARDEHGDVMGLRHEVHRVEGVQFHPESILSEHGPALLANFLAFE